MANRKYKPSFSDNLTPGMVQKVLDNLGIEWRSRKQTPTGWVDVDHDRFESDLGVNINHGGYVDHYSLGVFGTDAKGDLVTLVALILNDISIKSDLHPEDIKRAIEWIQQVCKLNSRKVKPPEVECGYLFAKDFKTLEGGKEEGKHVQIPKEIYFSNLTATEKIVWGSIFDSCSEGNICAWPTIRTICDKCKLSTGAVHKALKNLAKYNLIIEKPRGHNKSSYRFPLVAPTKVINKKIKQFKNQCSYNEQ